MLDESEFLSPHGVRAVSRCLSRSSVRCSNFAGMQYGIEIPRRRNPIPASFGGNSNWRGPVWMPVNFLLVESLRRFHAYYGDGATRSNARSDPASS